MNLQPDINSLAGIRLFQKNISAMIAKLEALNPIDDTSRQTLALLRLVRRLLEDKQEMLTEQESRTSEEIKKEINDLTGIVENLLALDELVRK